MLIGTGFREITLSHPLPLAGYENRKEPYTGITDKLEVNMLIIKDNDKKAILVSVDSLYISDELFNSIEKNDNTFIFAGASHTHFAPSLDPQKTALGETDSSYFLTVKKTIEQTHEKADLQPIKVTTIEHSNFNFSHTINRRRVLWNLGKNPFKWRRKIQMGPNFFGERNNKVYIIKLLDQNGNTIAIIWSLACHPTLFPKRTTVSSEYIGFVRNELRKEYGAIPILFFQGFSGDIRAKKINESYNISEEILHVPKDFIPFSDFEYEKWINKLTSDILTKKRKKTIHTPYLKFKQSSCPLKEIIERDIPGVQHLVIKEVSLGKNLSIIGFNAEPVSAYKSLFTKLFSKKTIIPVGCVGSTFGYLPTDKIVKEGGYEGGGFFKVFGMENMFKEKIEKKVSALIKRMYK